MNSSSGDCKEKGTVLHYRCVCGLLDFVKQLSQTDFRYFTDRFLGFLYSIYHFKSVIAVMVQGTVRVHSHACESCYESVKSLYTYKKDSAPSFTCDNLPWDHWGQPCCFSRKSDGPFSPLIGREVEWHLYYGDAKYTMVLQHNVGAVHSLCSSVNLFREWGSMRRHLSQRKT